MRPGAFEIRCNEAVCGELTRLYRNKTGIDFSQIGAKPQSVAAARFYVEQIHNLTSFEISDEDRPDKLVMPACDECNRGTSTADLVASLVSRWNYYSDETEKEDHRRLARQVRMHHPEIISEWTSRMDLLSRAKARRHLQNYGVNVPLDAGLVTIGPLTVQQLNVFAHKVVLGLYFDRFRKPLSAFGRVCAYWRTKEDFAREGVPSELLKMMNYYGTLEQGKWNAKEAFEYRYNENEKEGLYMCLARFRSGLYTTGFAVNDVHVLENKDNPDVKGVAHFDWIAPTTLLDIPTNERFKRRA